MINEIEEGARETVTVKLQVSPEYGGALRRGCGIYPCGPTLPNSLNMVPLSLQRKDDSQRESIDFHVYADMYFKNIDINRAPTTRERSV